MGNFSKRIEKANRILTSIKAASEKKILIDEKKLISMVCLEFGAGRRYITEIIEDLINTERIERFKGGLISREYFENERTIKPDTSEN